MSTRNSKNIIQNLTAIGLYVLPVIFFGITYFLQVVSSEDIYQGAGRPGSIITSALNAFHYSARFGDMYAYSIIHLFDYSYRFGLDTIFRLIDVVAGVVVIYLMSVFVLGRKPRLQVKDAVFFAATFLAVFLSEYGRSIFSSFSQIHNYLFISLFSLLFILPFIYWLRKRTLPHLLVNKLTMLIIGFLFGFSSNVTPVVFITTFIVVLLYRRLRLHEKVRITTLELVRSWQLFAFIGVGIALVVMYGLGPGLSSYTHGYNGTYVSLSELMNHPSSISALFGNITHNVELVLPEVMLLGLTLLFEYVLSKKAFIGKHKETSPGVVFSAVCLLFFVIHILAVSQINISATDMYRILLPAYECAIISVFFTVNRLLGMLSLDGASLMPAAVFIFVVTSVVTLDIGILMVHQRQQADGVLNRIKVSTEPVCVIPADNPTATSPLLKYHQRELFVTWAMPETIYGKQVNWCK